MGCTLPPSQTWGFRCLRRPQRPPCVSAVLGSSLRSRTEASEDLDTGAPPEKWEWREGWTFLPQMVTYALNFSARMKASSFLSQWSWRASLEKHQESIETRAIRCTKEVTPDLGQVWPSWTWLPPGWPWANVNFSSPLPHVCITGFFPIYVLHMNPLDGWWSQWTSSQDDFFFQDDFYNACNKEFPWQWNG